MLIADTTSLDEENLEEMFSFRYAINGFVACS